MSEAPDDIDTQVKAADPDRWLAARFIADRLARADVIALYALNHVTAKIVTQVSEPMMGHIRLAWWREAIEELAVGQAARAHPVVEALADPIRRKAFEPAELDALVDARAEDFEPDSFTDEVRFIAHIDATAGRLAAIAARRLDPASPPAAVSAAMRAWGLAGQHRNGRLPPSLAVRVVAAVDEQLEAARAELKALSVAAFPAVAYATLAADYARGKSPGPLRKQLALLGATLTGRI
jgi:phytoene synthase